jgi:tripartite-type tricarboxylate transporter receptor subunit TctC
MYDRPAIKRRAVLVGAAALSLSRPAFGQSRFPDRPIRLLIPWPPGASADAVLRLLGERAGRVLGQPVVPENRPGATGTLGAVAVKDARPDGYTLTQMHGGVFRTELMSQRPNYDSSRDFTYIIQLAGSLHGIVVRADSPWQTLQALLDHAKAHPGQVNYGTYGAASVQHMVMDKIAALQGLSWTHVPYRGGGDLYTGLLGRQIDVVADASGWRPLVQDGKFRLLATWGAERASAFPDAPTLRECGIDIVQASPYGVAGPRGMDPGVVKQLHDAFKIALDDPEVARLMEGFSIPKLYLDSADYTRSSMEQRAAEREGLQRLGMLGQSS